MKVIFLDNDGVICLSSNWGSRHKKQKEWGGRKLSMSMREIPLEYRFDNFDVKAVKVLNKILEETGAEIVVSSDWRLHASIEELGDYYESQGIIKRPIDGTEIFHYTNWLEEGFIKDHGEFPWSRNESREQERHFEIKRWLRDHPEVTHWVAVDDLHMGIHVENSSYGPFDREDWGLENFVWTPRDFEGIKQSGIKDKVLKFLND
jgi:hypothetical protein